MAKIKKIKKNVKVSLGIDDKEFVGKNRIFKDNKKNKKKLKKFEKVSIIKR
mgnify:FL=1